MIYEFKCPKCESIFEVQMKLADPKPESCAVCKETVELEKQISKPAGVQFKGSGFHVNEYKKAATK